MARVRTTAVRWVSYEPIPGWLEVHLRLADGSVARLFDKPPIFVADDDRLRPDSEFPIELALTCRADWGSDADPGMVSVTLANGLSDRWGTVTFRVCREQVTASDLAAAQLGSNRSK